MYDRGYYKDSYEKYLPYQGVTEMNKKQRFFYAVGVINTVLFARRVLLRVLPTVTEKLEEATAKRDEATPPVPPVDVPTVD